MHQKFGILILPETHTIHDVHCVQWTEEEICATLGIGRGRWLRQQIERTGDAIYVSAFLNEASAGEASRCEGFDLHGDRYYGPGLILGSVEGAVCPVLDPHDISRAIHFFRMDRRSDVVNGRRESLGVGR